MFENTILLHKKERYLRNKLDLEIPGLIFYGIVEFSFVFFCLFWTRKGYCVKFLIVEQILVPAIDKMKQMVWRGDYSNCKRVQLVDVCKYYIILHKHSFFISIASIQIPPLPVSMQHESQCESPKLSLLLLLLLSLVDVKQYTKNETDNKNKDKDKEQQNQKQQDKQTKEKMRDENFYFNGYDGYYEYLTPTPSPAPQIMFICNGIDTGLCENDILKCVYGVVWHIVNGMFDFYFFNLFVSHWVDEPEAPKFLSIRPLCVCVFLIDGPVGGGQVPGKAEGEAEVTRMLFYFVDISVFCFITQRGRYCCVVYCSLGGTACLAVGCFV